MCTLFLWCLALTYCQGPGWGWKENATLKGVAESNCYIVEKENFSKL